MTRSVPPIESEETRERLAREEVRLRRVGDDLTERLPGTYTTRLMRRPLPSGPLVLELYQVRHVLDLFVDGEKVAVWMHADDEASVFVQGPVADDAELSEIASCVEAVLTRLRVDGLQVGTRYRVSSDMQGLRAGSIVRFLGLDDVDNHYGRLEFEDELGGHLVVHGDFASERSEAARVHRYLMRVG